MSWHGLPKGKGGARRANKKILLLRLREKRQDICHLVTSPKPTNPRIFASRAGKKVRESSFEFSPPSPMLPYTWRKKEKIKTIVFFAQKVQ